MKVSGGGTALRTGRLRVMGSSPSLWPVRRTKQTVSLPLSRGILAA
jgi:hypothetical protein